MTTPPAGSHGFVSADATLREVAELLSDEGVSGAPVVSNGRVLGVISSSDIVDFAAAPPPPSRNGDSEVPRRPVLHHLRVIGVARKFPRWPRAASASGAPAAPWIR